MDCTPTPPGMADADELAHAREQIAALTAEAEALRAGRRDAVANSQEVTSRLRNMLANFRSVMRRTFETAETLEDVSLHLTGRFDALARYGAGTLAGRLVELEDIVRDELLNVHASDGPRVTIAGPTVKLNFRRASLVGLAVHELVTNSIKFGALATDSGSLSVRWELGGDAGTTLRLAWIETGVPVLASAPMRQGFGRQFIEQGLPYQLDADTLFELRPGGMRCEITLPASGMDTPPDADGHPPAEE